MNVLQQLREYFAHAVESMDTGSSAVSPWVQPSQDVRFGDYQINAAMGLAKQWKQSPRDVAQQIVDQLQLDELCGDPEIAGPGFINLTLRDDWLAKYLPQLALDPQLGATPAVVARTFVIDYSSPNVAKPMHVGHIRSTVIGDALTRVLRFINHKVVSDNHLGDWGTQFGMILYGYKHFLDRKQYDVDPVAELSRLYQIVNRLIDYHKKTTSLPDDCVELESLKQKLNELESQNTDDKKTKKQLRRMRQDIAGRTESIQVAEQVIAATQVDTDLQPHLELAAELESAVLGETAKLHEGNPENLELWQSFMPHCKSALLRVYERLGVTFDFEYGESFYQDRLAELVVNLQSQGLAEESDGAICVFSEEFETPMIIRKRDGAFLYATTDLATIEFRQTTWKPDAILYVVDHRQSQHFEKLFSAAKRMGIEHVEFSHVAFGTVLGDDGRPFRTRSGDVVGLESLLDEAVRRAHDVVSSNDDSKPGGAELDETQRRKISEVVGIGAIKYADLSHHRTSDYVFSYENMLALEGNTATYLQYSYARIRSIFAKGEVDPDALVDIQIWEWDAAIERELGLQLVRFPESLADVAAEFTPHQLTGYLYELANRFHRFYQQCHVLRAESESLRNSRLMLCNLVARTLKTGLELLGIGVVERM